MRHLMSPLDFSVEEVEQVLDLAKDIEMNPKKYAQVISKLIQKNMHMLAQAKSLPLYSMSQVPVPD